MRYCPKCQQELPDPIPHFCTKCGRDLSHEIRADGNRQNEGSDRAKRALLWTFSFILAGSLFFAGVMTAVVLKGKDKTPSDSPSARRPGSRRPKRAALFPSTSVPARLPERTIPSCSSL